METKKSVAVWLIDVNSKKILLQQRAGGEMGRPQSSPNICQPTWNGKLDGQEDVMAAVKREAEEELGKEFADSFDFSTLVLFDTNHYSFKEQDFTGYNYWGIATTQELKLIKLHSAAKPDFVAVNTEDMPKIKSKNDASADATKEIVLFDDQYQSLKKLFELEEIATILS